MICLKVMMCYLRSVPFVILSPYNFCFRCNLFVRDLDIYLFSRFNQIPIVEFSSMTSYMTLSTSNGWIVLTALISSSSHSSFVIFSGFFVFSYKAFTKPYCTNKSFTLLCHNPKLPIPSNLTKPTIAIKTLIAHCFDQQLWYQLLWKLTVCARLKKRKIDQTHEFTWFGNMSTSTGDDRKKASLRI